MGGLAGSAGWAATQEEEADKEATLGMTGRWVGCPATFEAVWEAMAAMAEVAVGPAQVEAAAKAEEEGSCPRVE